jgi:hypothetical protein
MVTSSFYRFLNRIPECGTDPAAAGVRMPFRQKITPT